MCSLGIAKNILDSPSIFKFEVGTFMATKLLQGTCRVKIQQSTRATSKRSKRSCGMDQGDAHFGCGDSWQRIERYSSRSLEQVLHPRKALWQRTLSARARDVSKTKGATAYLDTDRKRRRTLPEDPNIMMPPLCGISKNRNARRKLSA